MPKRNRYQWIGVGLLSVLVGCGESTVQPQPVGTDVYNDAPAKDSVETDSGAPDVGVTDTAQAVSDTGTDIIEDVVFADAPNPPTDVVEDVISTDTSTGTDASNSLGPFVYTSQCTLPEEPEGNGELKLVDAFPALAQDFNFPMGLVEPLDGSNRLFVYERFGTIKVLQNSPDATDVSIALSIGGKLYTGGEGGLLGMAIHPNFKENGYIYLNYTVQEQGQVYTIVSRFTGDSPQVDLIDPGSEVILLKIAQPYSNHNGGEVAFGHDGMLYVGMGDGGAGGDPLGHGQNLTTLHGAMLRIDVDNVSPGKNYMVPPDNPFAAGNGPEAPEIWAWGLRNPWRFSFDQLTGVLWAGDVGQKAWEEINIIEAGKNYGWNVMEGDVCYPPPNAQCDEAGLEPPIFRYPTAGKGSVTGGYVYRGTKVPALYGTYIFADYEHKTIWFLPLGALPPKEPAFQTPTKVAGFGQDAAGEVYVMGLLTGKIYRFEPVEETEPNESFPQTLSETDCFTDITTLEPVEGVLPYAVNHPFWSSGAEKTRFFVLPKGGKITYESDERWGFPEGTIFIKHFNLDVPGNAQIRLETRFLVLRSTGVRGYVYRWNDEGTEAHLLTSGDTRTVSDGNKEFVWEFPARHQCVSCHTEHSGGVLGLETRQLNGEHNYGGVSANQLEAIADWNLFESLPPELDGDLSVPSFPAVDDDMASVESRARAWLHVNCSSCHDGSPASGLDLNLSHHATLKDTKTCNVAAQKGDLGIQDSKLVAPGDPAKSIVYQRSMISGPYGMPPIASPLVDPVGTQILQDWITSLEGCP